MGRRDGFPRAMSLWRRPAVQSRKINTHTLFRCPLNVRVNSLCLVFSVDILDSGGDSQLEGEFILASRGYVFTLV